MKILYVLDSLQVGGAERSTLEIANVIEADSVVVCLYDKDELSKYFKESKIKFYNFNLSGKYAMFKAVNMLVDVIKHESPNVIVGTLYRAEQISRVASKLTGVPVVGTFVNDSYSNYHLNTLSPLVRIKVLLLKVINEITGNLCSGFLSNSHYIKKSNAAALSIPLHRIKVIHRGRDSSKYSAPSKAVKTVKPTVFVNVGRLIERKGQLELIKAFAIYKEKYSNAFTLFIAGRGPLKDRLESEIYAHGLEENVLLLGTVDDIPGLLSTCEVFVFPSYFEGFSGALVEAALAGIPIVASDIPMNREVLPEEYISLFQPKSVESLADSLFAIHDNWPEMVANADAARSYAILNYDINRIGAQHLSYYEDVISG